MTVEGMKHIIATKINARTKGLEVPMVGEIYVPVEDITSLIRSWDSIYPNGPKLKHENYGNKSSLVGFAGYLQMTSSEYDIQITNLVALCKALNIDFS